MSPSDPDSSRRSLQTKPDPAPDPGPDPDSGTVTDTGTKAGLYIHVPFCTSVCPYCDFAVTITGPERRQAWVDGIVREAAMYADCGLVFNTIYFGGGTPSSLETEHIAAVTSCIH